MQFMLGEERWDLVEGFEFHEKNLYSDFVFHAPSVLSLNLLDSLTAHYLQNNTYRQSYGAEQVPFVLFIDPTTFMHSNTTVFFSWYGCVFNKPACRTPDLSGKQGQ